MTQQIKIDQNPPVDIRDKNLSKQENIQIEIKHKDVEQIKIDSDQLDSSMRILEEKLRDSNKDSLVVQDRNKQDKKGALEEITANDLNKIKQATNEVLAQINIQLDFTLDKDLNRVVVKVINKETGKVIRQIPPEEMLKIAKRMEEMSGVLLDKWS